MNYLVNPSAWGGVFAVPGQVVDRYIKLASGNQLKVLLIFLSCRAGEMFSVEETARTLSLPEAEVTAALEQFRAWGLLYHGTESFQPDEKPAEKTRDKPVEKSGVYPEKKYHNVIKVTQFDPRTIAEEIGHNPDFDALINYCEEKIYGDVLKPAQLNLLANMLLYYDLSPEVSRMALDFCKSRGKIAPSAVLKMCADMCNSECRTVADAEAFLFKQEDMVAETLRRKFKMSGFSQNQADLLEKWRHSYKFTPEMIELAFDKTLDNTGKKSFKYMDEILTDWKREGITDEAGAALYNARHKEKTDDGLCAPTFDITKW